MSLVPEGDTPPSREELRQLEARVDARFQAVSARFTTVDRRFAGDRERLERLELHTRQVTERFDRHCKTVDGRFDATDARIDLVHDALAAKLERAQRELEQSQRERRRTMVLTAGGVSVIWVAMTCLVWVLA
jgi:chromosome segregation ATPase